MNLRNFLLCLIGFCIIPWAAIPTIRVVFFADDLLDPQLYYIYTLYIASIIGALYMLCRFTRLLSIRALFPCRFDNIFTLFSRTYQLIIAAYLILGPGVEYAQINANARLAGSFDTLLAILNQLTFSCLFILSLKAALSRMLFRCRDFYILCLVVLPHIFSGGRFGPLFILSPLALRFLVSSHHLSRPRKPLSSISLRFVLTTLASLIIIGIIVIYISVAAETRLSQDSFLLNAFSFQGIMDLFFLHLAIKYDSIYYTSLYPPIAVPLYSFVLRIILTIFRQGDGLPQSPTGDPTDNPTFVVADILKMGDTGNVGFNGPMLDYMNVGFDSLIINVILTVFLLCAILILVGSNSLISISTGLCIAGLPACAPFIYGGVHKASHLAIYCGILIMFIIVSRPSSGSQLGSHITKY